MKELTRDEVLSKIKKIVALIHGCEKEEIPNISYTDLNINLYKFIYKENFILEFVGYSFCDFGFKFSIFLKIKDNKGFKLNNHIDDSININIEKKQVESIAKDIKKRLIEKVEPNVISLHNEILNKVKIREKDKALGDELASFLKDNPKFFSFKRSSCTDKNFGQFSFTTDESDTQITKSVNDVVITIKTNPNNMYNILKNLK